jgi:ATP-dependent DNA helicase RecG
MGNWYKENKSTCLKVGLKEPLIKETGDFVDIELYRKVPESAGKMPEKAGKNLSINNQERMIIEFIKRNNKINSKDTENLINVKDRRARKILSDMVEKNIVKAVGNSRARYYVLEENNK